VVKIRKGSWNTKNPPEKGVKKNLGCLAKNPPPNPCPTKKKTPKHQYPQFFGRDHTPTRKNGTPTCFFWDEEKKEPQNPNGKRKNSHTTPWLCFVTFFGLVPYTPTEWGGGSTTPTPTNRPQWDCQPPTPRPEPPQSVGGVGLKSLGGLRH